MSIFSLPDVEKLKTLNDVDGLIKLLKFKKNKSFLWLENLFNSTTWRVMEWKKPLRGLKNFIALLRIGGSTADLRIRTEAAEALGYIGGKQAVNALTEALNDRYNDNRVQSAVMMALEKIQKGDN